MIDRGIATEWLREHGEPLNLGGPANDHRPAESS
jgi:hypothetical protein